MDESGIQEPEVQESGIASQASGSSERLPAEGYQFDFQFLLDRSQAIEADDNPSSPGGSIDAMSLTESIFEYQKENGRTYHAYRAGSYNFPNDDTENERLDNQHEILKIVLDGRNYIAPFNRPKKPRKVLDVATGTGRWAVEMGDELPGSEIVGIDLSPIQPTLVPPNVEFFIEDATDEWSHTIEDFDYIHTRITLGCWSDMPEQIIKTAYERLRPGGWFESQEAAGAFKYEGGADPALSTSEQWMNSLLEASESIGRPMSNAHMLKQWYIDAGFVDVHEKVYKIPMNGWPKNRRLKRIGEMWHKNLVDGCQAFSYALLHRVKGWTKAQIEVYLVQVRKDLADKRFHAYQEFFVVWGRKPLQPARRPPDSLFGSRGGSSTR